MISFKVTDHDRTLINQIVERAAQIVRTFGGAFEEEQVAMSLTACHANGCPLRLEDMAQADDFNLLHDVSGIHGTVNRRTGKIDGLFWPRFAAKQEE